MAVTESHRLDFDKLSPDIAEAFAANGVVCIRKLLSPDWIDLLREAVEAAIKNPGDKGGGEVGDGYFVVPSLWHRFEGFGRFASESPIGQAAAAIMGSKIARMYSDTIFVKERASPEPTPWHQDLPYFRMDGDRNCSAWIPLDPADQNSGAMSYAVGSHRWGKLFNPISFGREGGESIAEAPEFSGEVPDIDADPERYPTVGFTVEPGDVVFHHLATVHKAGPNNSRAVRRRVHTVRMAGDGATWLNRRFSTVDFDVDLVDGDPLEGAPFPVLWPRNP